VGGSVVSTAPSRSASRRIRKKVAPTVTVADDDPDEPVDDADEPGAACSTGALACHASGGYRWRRAFTCLPCRAGACSSMSSSVSVGASSLSSSLKRETPPESPVRSRKNSSAWLRAAAPPGSDADHRPRLPKMRAIYPPPPIRSSKDIIFTPPAAKGCRRDTPLRCVGGLRRRNRRRGDPPRAAPVPGCRRSRYHL